MLECILQECKIQCFLFHVCFNYECRFFCFVYCGNMPEPMPLLRLPVCGYLILAVSSFTGDVNTCYTFGLDSSFVFIFSKPAFVVFSVLHPIYHMCVHGPYAQAV